jgi:putative transposase
VIELGGSYIIANGMPDHVHRLTALPTTLTVSRLVGAVKGASSHFINHEIRPGYPFRRQHGFAAIAVGADQDESVIGYIRRQKEPHAAWNQGV